VHASGSHCRLRGPTSPLETHNLRMSTAPFHALQGAAATGGRFATATRACGRFAATAAIWTPGAVLEREQRARDWGCPGERRRMRERELREPLGLDEAWLRGEETASWWRLG
jgi:hypothetical protein